MNEAVLMIITAPNIEELMIDLLLEQPDISGFTSHIVNAHGAGAIELSMQEQVSGRQQKVQFMVYGTQSALQAFYWTHQIQVSAFRRTLHSCCLQLISPTAHREAETAKAHRG